MSVPQNKMSKIPSQKHSNDELSDLRARSAMQSVNSPIAETYNKKLAHRGIVILGYALPMIAPLWAIVKTMTKDTSYSMSDFYVMVIPVMLALVIALWIATLRVLSRHNSAFILIISVLCCFSIVTAVNSNKYLKYELMSLIGKGQSMADPLLDSESDSGSGDVKGDDIRETLRKAEDELSRERREWEREKLQRERDSLTPKTPGQ
ncbi:MAG: hypothetical protein ACI9E1_000471 [Cryomorphaceae bacterium]|jgi:hypothetical protein